MNVHYTVSEDIKKIKSRNYRWTREVIQRRTEKAVAERLERLGKVASARYEIERKKREESLHSWRTSVRLRHWMLDDNGKFTAMEMAARFDPDATSDQLTRIRAQMYYLRSKILKEDGIHVTFKTISTQNRTEKC